jgi:hypothetical protein
MVKNEDGDREWSRILDRSGSGGVPGVHGLVAQEPIDEVHAMSIAFVKQIRAYIASKKEEVSKWNLS